MLITTTTVMQSIFKLVIVYPKISLVVQPLDVLNLYVLQETVALGRQVHIFYIYTLFFDLIEG